MSPAKQVWTKTPLLYSRSCSTRVGCDVYIKLENLQQSGSFKFRGISLFAQGVLDEFGPSAHLIVASGGNAAFATCNAALALKLRCTAYIPAASIAVRPLLEELGATVVVGGKNYQEALESAKAAVEVDPQAVLVPAYDHPTLWKGHSSLVEEIAGQLPHGKKPDAIVCAVGGGGLLGGIILGCKTVGWDGVPIIAMETVGSNCFYQSFLANSSRVVDPSARGNESTVVDDNAHQVKVAHLSQLTSKAYCLGATSPSAGVLRLAVDRQGPVTCVCTTDITSMRTLVDFLDEHRMMVELACATALTPAYDTRILDSVLPTVRGNEESTIVFVACGGIGVSLKQVVEYREESLGACTQEYWVDGTGSLPPVDPTFDSRNSIALQARLCNSGLDRLPDNFGRRARGYMTVGFASTLLPLTPSFNDKFVVSSHRYTSIFSDIAMTMPRCPLRIPEILNLIFEKLDTPAGLVQASCVSRLWESIASDLLWSKNTVPLEALLGLLGPLSNGSDFEGNSLRIDLSSCTSAAEDHRCRRFFDLSSKITKLNASVGLAQEDVETLYWHPRLRGIKELPRLTAMEVGLNPVRATPSNIIYTLQLFNYPRLRSLEVALSFPYGAVQGLFQVLNSHKSQIHTVKLHHRQSDVRKAENSLRFDVIPNLREISRSYIDANGWKSLSSCANLEKLDVMVLSQASSPQDPDETIEPAVFPSLTTFGICECSLAFNQIMLSCSFPALRRINLRLSSVTALQMEQISNRLVTSSTQLEEVDLDFFVLETFDSLRPFLRLDNLRSFQLRQHRSGDLPVSDENVELLVQSCKKLEVITVNWSDSDGTTKAEESITLTHRSLRAIAACCQSLRELSIGLNAESLEPSALEPPPHRIASLERISITVDCNSIPSLPPFVAFLVALCPPDVHLSMQQPLQEGWDRFRGTHWRRADDTRQRTVLSFFKYIAGMNRRWEDEITIRDERISKLEESILLLK
ncbi:hypothetical protein FRB99_001173 [Tulasnella sp. 403]|nr:hypothetical protein FRB99_001173 [Tulasnella sp. 403]